MAILNVLEDSPTEWTTTKEEGLKDALQDGTVDINTAIGYFTQVTINGNFTLPTVDGTSDQVMKTNGSGVLTWTTITPGIANVVEDTTPQLGGNLDLNSKGITQEETAGESIVSGDLCYLKTDGKYWKTDADAEATASAKLLLCIDTIAADATGTFLVKGKYTTTGLTAGSNYYVSATAGEITVTAPSTTGQIVRLVGTAESTTVLEFKTDNTFIEVP